MFATQQVGRSPGKIEPITNTEAIEITISVMASRMDRHCNGSCAVLLFVILILKLFRSGILSLNFFLTCLHISLHFVIGCLCNSTDGHDLDGRNYYSKNAHNECSNREANRTTFRLCHVGGTCSA